MATSILLISLDVQISFGFEKKKYILCLIQAKML